MTMMLLSQIRNLLSKPLYLLQRHGWTIVFAFLLVYLLNAKVIQPRLQDYKREKSYREATNPERVRLLSRDMKRIRERQQVETKRRAEAAKEEEEKKRVEEMKRRRIANPSETKRGGHRLGSGEDDETTNSTNNNMRSSYNPMSPNSGASSGGYYRPSLSNRYSHD